MNRTKFLRNSWRKARSGLPPPWRVHGHHAEHQPDGTAFVQASKPRCSASTRRTSIPACAPRTTSSATSTARAEDRPDSGGQGPLRLLHRAARQERGRSPHHHRGGRRAQDKKAGSDPQKVGDLYQSFMDTARIQALGLEPARADLNRIAASRTSGNCRALRRAAAHGRAHAVRLLRDAGCEAGGPLHRLRQPGRPGLPDRDYYFKQEPASSRRAPPTSRTSRRCCGWRVRRSRPARPRPSWPWRPRCGEALDRVRNRDREATYNLKSVAELEKLTPGFSWTRFLKAVDAEKTPGVVVRQPDYSRPWTGCWPARRCPCSSSTSPSSCSTAPRPAEHALRGGPLRLPGKMLQGLQENRPRWKRGVEAVDGSLGEVVGRLYVERNFSPESKAACSSW